MGTVTSSARTISVTSKAAIASGLEIGVSATAVLSSIPRTTSTCTGTIATPTSRRCGLKTREVSPPAARAIGIVRRAWPGAIAVRMPVIEVVDVDVAVNIDVVVIPTARAPAAVGVNPVVVPIATAANPDTQRQAGTKRDKGSSGRG